MNNLEVQIDDITMKLPLQKFVAFLIKSQSRNPVRIKNLWDLVEQMDSSKFCELQSNVYFADFLRQIEIHAKQEIEHDISNNCVDEFLSDNIISDQIHANDDLLPIEVLLDNEAIKNVECPVFEENLDDIDNTENSESATEPSYFSNFEIIEDDKSSITPIVDFLPSINEKQDIRYHTDTKKLPDINDNLDDVVLPDRFMKLIRRLKNASLQNEWFFIGNKIQDLLNVKVDDVNKIPGVGSFYIETLKEIKGIYSNSENYEVSEVFDIPDKSILIDDAILPERFNKLIKRLKNASINNNDFILGDRIEDVINLSLEDISKLPRVGASYVDTLREFKSLYFPEIEDLRSTFSLNEVDISNFLLSMAGMEQDFIKCITKYVRHFELSNISDTVPLVLGFEEESLLKLPSFGNSTVKKLLQIKEIVKEEITRISKGEINYLDLRSTIIVPKFIDELELNRIEEVLLEDIDSFLDKQTEEDVEIAQSRWGFVEEHKTLEEVGKKLDVTRERIRQKEAEINSNFLLNLRINSSTLWHLLEKYMTPSLCFNMKGLFSCFYSEKTFFDFFSLICQRKGLFDYVYPNIDRSLFNSVFAENGAPIHMNDAIEIINRQLSDGFTNANNTILSIERLGNIVIKDDYIWPRLLGKSEASACVLFSHPKGLPWMDIAKIVNANGYSRTDIYETRLDHEALNDKDYIYLAGTGVYKHTRFIITENIDLDRIFAELDLYVSKLSREVFHLNECYMSSEYLKSVDYYVIRHFVKHFGEDFGYYFQGRSQTDSVGLNKNFKRITQKDVIIEAMKSRAKPFTKPEIAALLKSKSIPHASFYIDGMLNEGKVVQVDQQLYTTPELAYEGIDVDSYLSQMFNIMKQYEKPVDASIFQQIINDKFFVSYSKHFYMGIARCFSGERGWYRSHGLYSIWPIPFSNLTDALNSYCYKDDPVKISIERLQSHIAITSENASWLIHSWRNAQD